MRCEADQLWIKVRRGWIEVNKTKHELDSCRVMHPRLRQALDRERQMYSRLALERHASNGQLDHDVVDSS